MQRVLVAGLLAITLMVPLGTRALDNTGDAAYWKLQPENLDTPPLRSRIGAKVDDAWLYSTDYPIHQKTLSLFQDQLGEGTLISVRHTGRPGAPDLICELKIYRDRDFSSILVRIENTTKRTISVSRIRLFEGNGRKVASLRGPLAKTRVLSDSYSEDTPVMRIYNFNEAPFSKYVPHGIHLAVGSQLLYNLDSGLYLFAGALTSRRWLTIFHLTSEHFTIDDEGTTELTSLKSLSPSRPQDHIILNISVAANDQLDSVALLISTGKDYLKAMQAYGAAVKTVNHARIAAKAPWGWWSWTAYYDGITEGLASTNALWLADHLEKLGYRYLHIDEGYDYARGEYTTTDPVKFSGGMEHFARTITKKGLTLGLWTAPFEVSSKSWIYQHHKDWLVANRQGEPIWLGDENLYALDTTNPGAQEYLMKTYWTLVVEAQ